MIICCKICYSDLPLREFSPCNLKNNSNNNNVKTKNNQLKKISPKNKIKIKSQKMTQMVVVEPSKRSPSSLSNRSF